MKLLTFKILIRMSFKTFKTILGEGTKLSFEFDDIVIGEAADNSTILTFALTKPIDRVIGSRSIRDEGTNTNTQLEAYDVTTVKMGPDALEAIEAAEAAGKQVFTWIKEGKAGTFNCPGDVKLRFDVTNGLDVWVKAESFSQWTRNRRNTNTSNTRQSILAKMQERKAKSELKNADVNAGEEKPTPVAATA